MADAKNTFVDFELDDGSVIKLTLTYRYLLQFKTKCKSLYDRYNKIIVKGVQDEFDNLTIIYTAYLCAYLQIHGSTEESMTEDAFIDAVSSDREAVSFAIQSLIYPKKARASRKPL